MDEIYERYLKASGYLDKEADAAQERENKIIEMLVKIIIFVAGCICGAVFF